MTNLWNTKQPNYPVLNTHLVSSLNSFHSLFLLSIRWFSNGEDDDSIHDVEHVNDRRQRRLLSLQNEDLFIFFIVWKLSIEKDYISSIHLLCGAENCQVLARENIEFKLPRTFVFVG